MIDTKSALPIIVSKEGKWYVASCPMLDVATQGKTEGEVRRNIHALIDEYMKDPDTKPRRQMFYISVTI